MEQGFSEELKQRQRYWLDHLRAASAQGLRLAEYARTAQVDSDALYRWRALFKRRGVSIAANPGAAPVGFAAVRITTAEVSHSGAVMIHVGAAIQVCCASLPEPQWLAELSQRLQERR
jgi:hypothetical protein